jgi:SpoIID/LytB domain protein
MRRVACAVAIAALFAVPLVGGVPGAASATVTEPPITIGANQTHLMVTYRGNGHGHGMSQWGAFGAATMRRTYQQILAFYYPRTVFRTAPTSARIRVLLTDAGSSTMVQAQSGLLVSGVASALKTTNVLRYRLVANTGTGLNLQRLSNAKGAHWLTIHANLANNAEFHRTGYAAVRLYLSDGTSTSYYGVLRAVRASPSGTSGGVQTVNRLTYDKYVQGVVPRESPASWPAAATDAQAVAARTYGDFEVHNSAPGSSYDICDTSSCQVYGGHVHYNHDGTVRWTDFPKAAADTSNKILKYAGQPVFAQFSASNGGWLVAGDPPQPYLVAKADPYDIAKYDPYINAVVDPPLSVKAVANRLGLTKLTELTLTRDGHGTWGGRVVGGTVTGTGVGGQPVSIDITGGQLQSALALGTTWVQITPAA